MKKTKKEQIFYVPCFFESHQLFADQDEFIDITFIKKGVKITPNNVDAKKKAFKYCEQLNSTNDGSIVRLTLHGSIPRAYVVIDPKNKKQVRWLQSQKQKRLVFEEKLGLKQVA